MIIFAETNGNLYNMGKIQYFEKSGDTEIIFHYDNGNKIIEKYNNSNDRDNTYNNIVQEFVKKCDSNQG